jgi:hypothetical protein
MSVANQSFDLQPVRRTIYLEGGHVDELGSILPAKSLSVGRLFFRLTLV